MLQYGFFTAQNTGTAEEPEYDRTYGEAYFSQLLSDIFGVGVRGFEVRPNGGLTVTVTPGAGCINGYYFYDNVAAQLTINTVTAARTDSVAFRLNYAERAVSLVVLEGTTAPTRTSTIHDIIIAQIVMPENTATITGTMITDTWNDYILCGRLPSLHYDILYENFAGSESDITLADSTMNYEYIEIFYLDNDNIASSVKVAYPVSGTRVDLTVCVPRPSGSINIKSRTAYINGNKIETKSGHNDYAAEVTGVGGAAESGASINHIYITKVLGWR